MVEHSMEHGGYAKFVSASQLRQLTNEAAAAPRKRSHLLLHSRPEDLVQRLVIAAQPGTYVRPHQHTRQWEMLVLQHGSIDILIFDETGEVLGRSRLDEAAPIVEIPVAAWHTCVVWEPGTLIVEIKPGPFRPNEFCNWAPEEGGKEAVEFLHWVTSAEPGQKWKPS
jgi:cupin fold WbuC family metalloprotein